MYCPACGQEADQSARFCPNCGHSLNGPAPDYGPGETGSNRPAAAAYGGFWRRLLAYFIDGILVYIVATGAAAVVGYLLGMHLGVIVRWRGVRPGADALRFLLVTLISWLYWAGLESSQRQATVGKKALGLKVTDMRGEPISFGRATGRYFGKYLSALILGIGFLMIGWTAKKQALHDFMAGTLVVKRQTADEPS
jgi:uncharacterized RDD family membrane protein YckC